MLKKIFAASAALIIGTTIAFAAIDATPPADSPKVVCVTPSLTEDLKKVPGGTKVNTTQDKIIILSAKHMAESLYGPAPFADVDVAKFVVVDYSATEGKLVFSFYDKNDCRLGAVRMPVDIVKNALPQT